MQDYWLNHAFLLGSQWVWFHPQTRRLDEIPRDPERVQATMNRLWPNSRIIISKAMQRELTFEVPPSAADDASIRGAKIAESIVEVTRVEHDWEKLREEWYWTAWKGGTAVVCVDWDPKAGTAVLPGDADSGAEPVMGGDTVETVLSIAEVAVEPGVRDAERASWWIKCEALPPSTVMGSYGLSALPAADASAGMTPFQRKLLSEHAGGSSDDSADLTLVLTYYERPNPNRPDGAIAVVVGNEIVGGGVKPWPFPFTDHLNFALGCETPIETKWAGETVLTMARPVQVAYNASWSSIIEHMKNAGNARLAVPQSSIDLMEHFTDLPGEQVPYPDGLAHPEWISPAQMPAWWIEQPVRLREEMDDIMGVHDISRGEAPVNIESGYGLSVLAEQDTTPVGKLVKTSAVVWSKVATMCLQLYAANVMTTREAIVRTPSQPPTTAHWTGADLKGQLRATVPMESVLPRNKAAMAALAEKLVTMGLITTFEQFATIAEVPGYRSLIDRVNPDTAKARRENHMMSLGRPAVPESFDKHDIHLNELNDYCKSPDYEMLDDSVKTIFEDHRQAHVTMAAEEAGSMRARAAVDPVLAAVPDGYGSTTLAPAEVNAGMSPAGTPPEEPGAEAPIEPAPPM